MADHETPETTLISRYSSRRLYNTQTSDYVTLDDIAELISNGQDVKIVDKKSGDDLTRQILLQIITERESRGENVLPQNVLMDIVRSYSDQAQDLVPDFLEQSFRVLKKQQQEILETLDPDAALKKLQQWQQDQYSSMDSAMKTWMGGFGFNKQDHNSNDESPEDELPQNAETSLDQESEVEALKKQFKELQNKIENL